MGRWRGKVTQQGRPLARVAKYVSREYHPGASPVVLAVPDVILARQHVQTARDRVDRQRALIGDLRSSHSPTDVAEALLETFISSLSAHEDHLERLLRQRDRRSN